jgi:hypothetical protein
MVASELKICDKSSKERINISDAIALFTSDIAKKTGLSEIDVKTISLHKIEKSRSIKIKKPRRDNNTRIGYHRNPHCEFITPEKRDEIIKQFDEDFNFSLGTLFRLNGED